MIKKKKYTAFIKSSNIYNNVNLSLLMHQQLLVDINLKTHAFKSQFVKMIIFKNYTKFTQNFSQKHQLKTYNNKI